MNELTAFTQTCHFTIAEISWCVILRMNDRLGNCPKCLKNASQKKNLNRIKNHIEILEHVIALKITSRITKHSTQRTRAVVKSMAEFTVQHAKQKKIQISLHRGRNTHVPHEYFVLLVKGVFFVRCQMNH